MDELDIRLLELLQLDGRTSISKLSKELALSRPSISERLNRLQEKGVIDGFSARVSPAAVGRDVLVYIQLSDLRIKSYTDFEKWLLENPNIIECHRLTGSISYLLKAAVPSMDHLSKLIDSLLPFGNANTSIVLSSPVPFKCILPDMIQQK
ncbi:Lrp/AsnC family leucine-responsive transcriptional regulator [Bacillus fengqiuensis]|nr:Lrp/AsnC family leucine-responsive transcriptional regulator [Bacillus fengqiuensis]